MIIFVVIVLIVFVLVVFLIRMVLVSAVLAASLLYSVAIVIIAFLIPVALVTISVTVKILLRKPGDFMGMYKSRSYVLVFFADTRYKVVTREVDLQDLCVSLVRWVDPGISVLVGGSDCRQYAVVVGGSYYFIKDLVKDSSLQRYVVDLMNGVSNPRVPVESS